MSDDDNDDEDHEANDDDDDVIMMILVAICMSDDVYDVMTDAVCFSFYDLTFFALILIAIL